MHTSMLKHFMNYKKMHESALSLQMDSHVKWEEDCIQRDSMRHHLKYAVNNNLLCIVEVANWLTWHMNITFFQRFNIRPVHVLGMHHTEILESRENLTCSEYFQSMLRQEEISK